MELAAASPSSLACLYFSRHAIFQPSGLALSLVVYGTDVSISRGSFTILCCTESSRGNTGVVRQMDKGGMGGWRGCSCRREELQGWVMPGMALGGTGDKQIRLSPTA